MLCREEEEVICLLNCFRLLKIYCCEFQFSDSHFFWLWQVELHTFGGKKARNRACVSACATCEEGKKSIFSTEFGKFTPLHHTPHAMSATLLRRDMFLILCFFINY